MLLDLHALPGGANDGEHSGTNSGSADLWGNKTNLSIGVQCVEFVAKKIRDGLQGIVGIQLCNEAKWDAPGMYDWYDSCISTASAINANIPIIISDGWNLPKALDYVAKKNVAYPSNLTCPVMIDTHYYWAFTPEDKAKTPQAIINEASTKMSDLDGKEGSVLDRGAIQVIVGEYSCVLTEDTWAKASSDAKPSLVKQFGQAQSQRWQSRAGGSYFWTYKMVRAAHPFMSPLISKIFQDWLPGGEWGFIPQTNNRAIIPPSSLCIPPEDLRNRLQGARDQVNRLMQASVNGHVDYWNNAAPNKPFEHWRYENGWKLGFSDALAFGANKIGCLELWVLKRIRDSGMRGPFVWEFEQGLRAGISAFYQAARL